MHAYGFGERLTVRSISPGNGKHETVQNQNHAKKNQKWYLYQKKWYLYQVGFEIKKWYIIVYRFQKSTKNC